MKFEKGYFYKYKSGEVMPYLRTNYVYKCIESNKDYSTLMNHGGFTFIVDNSDIRFFTKSGITEENWLKSSLDRDGYYEKNNNNSVRSSDSTTKHSNDMVNHPAHYTTHPSGIECIEVTRHYCFSIGNAIKYLWRAGIKSEASMSNKDKEIQDLKKAIWYINDRINQLENEGRN